MAENLLEEGLQKLGLGGDGRVLSLLARYMEEIELFNSAYGLVKVSGRRELIVKHILDSLAPIDILRDLVDRQPAGQNIPQIADIGSGAGLPGIPLAICMHGAEFTLVERMGRRAGFLLNVIAVLGLSSVRVEESEMEKLIRPSSGAGRFDIVVFRAFKPLESAILKNLTMLLAPGGVIAAYKGRRESIDEEMARLELLGRRGKIRREIIPVKVPFLEDERHLLVIRNFANGQEDIFS